MYGEFDIYIIQVEEAEAVLYQIKQLYKTGHMDSDKMSTLTDDFYQALPHRKKYTFVQYFTAANKNKTNFLNSNSFSKCFNIRE
jgi:hypothetical protein